MTKEDGRARVNNADAVAGQVRKIRRYPTSETQFAAPELTRASKHAKCNLRKSGQLTKSKQQSQGMPGAKG